MNKTKAINKFLTLLYYSSGIELNCEYGELKINNTDSVTKRVYSFLLRLRDKNKKVYLDCLRTLIFCEYTGLDMDDTYADFISGERKSFIQKYDYNEEIEKFPLNLYNNKKRNSDVKKLLEYIRVSKNVIDFDGRLYNDNNMELLKLLVENHIKSMYECGYELTCSGMMQSFCDIDLYLKYVTNDELFETEKVATKYLIENDPTGLMDLLEMMYDYSESYDKTTNFHNYIISNYDDENHFEGLTDYISNLLYYTYIRGLILLEMDKCPSDLVNYVNKYQDNSDGFLCEMCDKVLSKDKPIDLFIKYIDVGDFLDYDDISCDVKVSMDYTRKIVKKHMKKKHN